MPVLIIIITIEIVGFIYILRGGVVILGPTTYGTPKNLRMYTTYVCISFTTYFYYFTININII